MNILSDQWAFAPTEELLAMVNKCWQFDVNALTGTSIIDERWECPALRAWMDYATGLLVPLAPKGGKVVTFAVINPMTDDEWAPGYPHNHSYAYHALVHYLDPGGDARPLIVWDDEPPFDRREFACVAGQTYVLEGKTMHGVQGSNSSRPRVALGMISSPPNTQFTKEELPLPGTEAAAPG